MAQVSLQINGYAYVLGCADGEENHLRALAAGLDRRIDEIKGATGLTGEARLLLMAALVLADELHDIRGKSAPRDGAPAEKPAPRAGRRLKGIAKRAEDLAATAAAPLDPDAPGLPLSGPEPDGGPDGEPDAEPASDTPNDTELVAAPPERA